jgi:pimeloyl-ACP methyl ester carboxylesterase
MSASPVIRNEEILLHGNRVTYRAGGRGPVLVLVHGITGSGRTWDGVIRRLAREHTVIAPDMLGHGQSAKPRGDYSLGAYASAVRDLLAALGHDRATVVGHSLGGGVAMQFAYQFPERLERLVLVSSGGLGREVNLILRAATLPGSEIVLPLLCANRVVTTGAALGRLLRRTGLAFGPDLEETARGFASLGDAGARQAFIQTARGIIDIGGQRVDATDRLYLARAVPTLLVWGEHDPMIPAEHGRRAHALMPGSRLLVLPHAGHFPHRDDPDEFIDALTDFIAETEPADVDEERMRELMRSGGAAAA